MKLSKNFQILPKITKRQIIPEDINLGFIGGQCGSGKTFIMLQMLKSFYEQGKKCAFISLEMSSQNLLKRFETIYDIKKVKNPGSIVFANKDSQIEFFNFLNQHTKNNNIFDVIFIEEIDIFARRKLGIKKYKRKLLIEKFQGTKYKEPNEFISPRMLQRDRRIFLADLRAFSSRYQTQFFGSLQMHTRSPLRDSIALPRQYMHDADLILTLKQRNHSRKSAVITCLKNRTGDVNFSVNIPLIPKK